MDKPSLILLLQIVDYKPRALFSQNAVVQVDWLEQDHNLDGTVRGAPG